MRIKFRGRNIDTGEVVFGDLRIIGIHPHIFKEAQCYYDEELIEVDKDSVAQLVGYDVNDNEVYEGDKVISEYGDEVVARLMDNLPPKAKLKLSEDTK